MANMLFVSFRRSRRGELFTEDTFTEGQPQLGVDMATPSLSVLVMSSEILHALDGGRTVEGRGGRGEVVAGRRSETQAGGVAGGQTTGWPAAECQKSECGT